MLEGKTCSLRRAFTKPVSPGLLHCGETVVHLEWCKDVLLHVGGVGLPRDRLHDQPEDIVVGAAILVATTHRSIERDRDEAAHKLLQGHRDLVCLTGGGGQTAWYDRYK